MPYLYTAHVPSSRLHHHFPPRSITLPHHLIAHTCTITRPAWWRCAYTTGRSHAASYLPLFARFISHFALPHIPVRVSLPLTPRCDARLRYARHLHTRCYTTHARSTRTVAFPPRMPQHILHPAHAPHRVCPLYHLHADVTRSVASRMVWIFSNLCLPVTLPQ